MWTEITRVKYRRDGLRYASDMSTPTGSSPVGRAAPIGNLVGLQKRVTFRKIVEAVSQLPH